MLLFKVLFFKLIINLGCGGSVMVLFFIGIFIFDCFIVYKGVINKVKKKF